MTDQERGLYQKFIVTRTDGSSKAGKKHARCEYFVLDLNHDRHAVAALRAYAESCNEEFPQLAADLRNKARERAFCWANSQATDTKRQGDDQRREHDEHKGETR